MPYKLSDKGFKLIHANTQAQQIELQGLTDLQHKALDYLNSWFGTQDGNDQPVYVDAADVAKFWGLSNGQYFRGVLASLHKKGLLDKKEY